ASSCSSRWSVVSSTRAPAYSLPLAATLYAPSTTTSTYSPRVTSADLPTSSVFALPATTPTRQLTTAAISGLSARLRPATSSLSAKRRRSLRCMRVALASSSRS
ncbi:hypothetical protein K437DRAFT_260426, partial [Tilletiaria anomala UBC 951]